MYLNKFKSAIGYFIFLLLLRVWLFIYREPKDAPNGPEGEGEGDAALPAEEERKELTLDEWKALRGNRQKPQYNLRKAGEGEDPSQWKKMYALQKKKEGEEEDDDNEASCF